MGQLEMTQYLLEKNPNMINEVESVNETPGHYAAEGGNVAILQYLTDKGLNPWCRSATQETLLHRSCFKGQLEITQYLLVKYPNMINEVDIAKETPAHYAAFGGNISVVQYLNDKGSNPWCRTARQETLLHKSCIGGQMEMTEYLLEKYPNMINKVDYDKRTPAHYAAQSGSVSILQCLIDKGLNPCCRTATQETLLHKSCFNGRLEMTLHLLEKYPNMINEVDNCNGTPAHYAAQSGEVAVLQSLFEEGLNPMCKKDTQETVLHKSCISAQLEMTQYLLEKYPNLINETDSVKATPAHNAAEGGNVSILQYLIDKGLNPWCRTATQETLLHKSCISGQLEMSQYLLEKYPNMINDVNSVIETPAHYAAEGGNVSVLRYLIDKGLNPWCRTATQETLLEMTQYLLEKYPNMTNEVDIRNGTTAHYAARGGNVSVLQYLIDKGLNPWCRTATQETLLHKSCISVQLGMSQYLLEKYPNMINEVDSAKRTPAHYAAEVGNVSVLGYLIDKGLHPRCRTATQETLLHRSCISVQLEMTQYLLEKYPNMMNEVDFCNGTPAHYAARGGNVSVLQCLIDKGLNPWCRTATQETLLHMSCFEGQLEMTEYLLEKYPNMTNEVDNDKRAPAHYVAISSNICLLECLIDHGLDVMRKSATQQTLLHMSCFAGQLEMTRYLVETFHDLINVVDNCNRTPAHFAACGRNVSVLQYLIDQGLDSWCRTVNQETLLHRSCFNGRLEMTQYLVEKYPDMVNALDSYERTPAHYADRLGNDSVLLYLTDKGLYPQRRLETEERVIQ